MSELQQAISSRTKNGLTRTGSFTAGKDLRDRDLLSRVKMEGGRDQHADLRVAFGTGAATGLATRPVCFLLSGGELSGMCINP